MSGMIKVPFHDDEVSFSFVSRMARANGRNNVSGFAKDFGLNKRLIVDGDINEIRKLADVLGVQAEWLHTRTPRRANEKGFEFGGSTYANNTLSSNISRFCPLCLAADEANEGRMPGTRRYARAIWQFPSVFSCVQHDAALETVPRLSREPVPDACAVLDACSYRFHEAGSWRYQPANDFEHFVDQRLRLEKGHGNFLDGLPLGAAIDSCDIVGSASVFGKHYKTRSLHPEEWRSALLEGLRILRSSPDAINQMLARLVADDDGKARTPRSLYGDLYDILRSRGADHEPLRALVREYTMANVAVTSKKGFWGVEHGKEWVSPGAIGYEIHMDQDVVVKILSRYGLHPIRTSRATSVYPRADVDRCLKLYRETIPSHKVREVLGLAAREFPTFEASGVLVPVPEHGTGRSRRYRRSDVQKLLRNANKVKDTTGLQHLDDVDARVRPRDELLFRAIFKGRMSTIAYKPSTTFARSCWVDGDELERVLRKLRREITTINHPDE